MARRRVRSKSLRSRTAQNGSRRSRQTLVPKTRRQKTAPGLTRGPLRMVTTKRQVGLLRILQAGVIVSDYATLMVEVLSDNARPEAAAVYCAIDMPWAKLVGQIAQAYAK